MGVMTFVRQWRRIGEWTKHRGAAGCWELGDGQIDKCLHGIGEPPSTPIQLFEVLNEIAAR